MHETQFVGVGPPTNLMKDSLVAAAAGAVSCVGQEHAQADPGSSEPPENRVRFSSLRSREGISYNQQFEAPMKSGAREECRCR